MIIMMSRLQITKWNNDITNNINEIPIYWKDVLYVILLAIIIFTSGCKKMKHKTEVKKRVTEWVGKEIRYPENLQCNFSGKDTISAYCTDLLRAKYKILLYVDSTGCTSCKLQLSEWNDLINEMRNLPKDRLSFLFFFYPKEKLELQYLLKKDRFYYPVFIDTKDRINQLNKFPNQASYQCLLLDKDNKVLMLGNPVQNPKIWELYKRQIEIGIEK